MEFKNDRFKRKVHGKERGGYMVEMLLSINAARSFLINNLGKRPSIFLSVQVRNMVDEDHFYPTDSSIKISREQALRIIEDDHGPFRRVHQREAFIAFRYFYDGEEEEGVSIDDYRPTCIFLG